MDKHDLYELCVQSPRHLALFLRELHGNNPVALREDFCGTAYLSRRWVAEGLKRGDDARAVATDLDPDALARARREADHAGIPLSRLHLLHADATTPAPPPHIDPELWDAPADVVFVGNFSIGYIFDRPTLLNYLRRSHARLARGGGGWGGGIFVCDTYGGSNAYKTGVASQRTHVGRRGEIVTYTWEHVSADPITATVENAIHFRVREKDEVTADLPSAFTYRWRLWTIPELRDAMHEAGFTSTAVYARLTTAPGEPPEPVRDPGELDDNWVVCVVGRL